MKDERMTKAWQRYEQGRSYNNRLSPNLYEMVNTNIEFFSGNQWVHLKQTPAMQRLPKPVFNIIKRVASLFVASLTSSAASISFDELSYYSSSSVHSDVGIEQQNSSDEPPEVNAATIATAEVQNLLEKFKMDFRIREALFDGAQTGDYCAHFYWDADAIPYGGAFGPYRGEIQMELVDGVNVMFGNPNITDVTKQPYILVIGRDTVENLEAERKAHKKSADGSAIDSDNEFGDMAGQGGRTELESDAENGKALYVYMYEMKESKVDGEKVRTVHVTKATRTCTIYEDIDTGLSRYPIAWGNWEKQKNQYHGRALVTGIIPNQIFINTMFAMVMRHLQLMGFPKTVYNADLISKWSAEVGQAIGVRGLQPGQDISRVAYNLAPADMSNQIIMAIDKAVSYTKDCLGATDAQLGNVKPDNTSALMVLQSNAEVPLENTRAGMYEWLEDIGAILLDMMGTYYGTRPMVRDRTLDEPMLDAAGMPEIDPVTGMMRMNTVTRRVMENFDFTKFKHLWFNVRVNAGATTYYSEIAMVQTLDNLRRDGTLEVIDYLERIPDKLIPRKAELVRELKRKAAQMPQGMPPVGGKGGVALSGGKTGSPTIGGPLSEDKALAGLPANMQAKYSTMPASAQSAMRQIGSMGQ